MLQAIIFDLDDTLYPERQYVLSGYRAVSRWCEEHLGLSQDAVFGELVELLDAGHRGMTFDLFLQRNQVDDAATVKSMVDVYRNHEPHIDVYPGVRQLLSRLVKRMQLGVLSDGHLSVQRKKFNALGVGQYFNAVVFSDEFGKESWKPSEKPFLRAAHLLGVEAKDCVYVGENSLKDFFGARKIGMTTIRVLGPEGFYTSMDPPTAEHAADITIDSLGDLESSLEAVIPQ